MFRDFLFNLIVNLCLLGVAFIMFLAIYQVAVPKPIKKTIKMICLTLFKVACFTFKILKEGFTIFIGFNCKVLSLAFKAFKKIKTYHTTEREADNNDKDDKIIKVDFEKGRKKAQ